MALSNKGELKTSIMSWMLAMDPATGADGDDIVRLAQNYLSLKLRCNDMLVEDTALTIASGTATLPTYFQSPSQVVQIIGTRRVPLTPLPKVKADEIYSYQPTGTEAVHFSITGNKIRCYPTLPDGSSLQLTYFKALEPIANDGDTDWLLTKHPAAYLSAGQMFAAEFIKEDGEAKKQAAICDTFISLINSQDDMIDYNMAEFQPYGGDTVP